jgi:two-component system catabolic regulation response regulator CreB/two-component system response regulator ChvI
MLKEENRKKRHLQRKENNNNNATSEDIPSKTKKETTTTMKPSYRVLFVDDNNDILLTIKEGLEYHGFIVDTFSNPLEALSSFKPELYDLVLIDVKMPQMSGFEFHQELRKKATYGTQIKTCFITAYEIYFETLKKEFPELYGGCFIRKPIKIEDLVSKINEELNQKSNVY